MNVRYFRTNGKKPLETKENREYFDAPPKGDHAAVLPEDWLEIDVDDYTEKGKPIDFIRGEPRSNAIKKILDDLGLVYAQINTEKGKHFYLSRPKGFTKNRSHLYCSIGIKVEWKAYDSSKKDHEKILLRVNGVNRTFCKGGFDSELSVCPAFLLPIPKNMGKAIDFDLFMKGSRNNDFSEYCFKLIGKGYQLV